MSQEPAPGLLSGGNIGAFFQESITSTMQRQRVVAQDATVVYLVNLLVCFMRSEGLFEQGEGSGVRPLALMYGDAVSAPNGAARYQALRRLGDVALFVAGLFSSSLRRKPVDVDYYVAMGGNAYGYLADSPPATRAASALAETFAELACKFVTFVDVLGEVYEQAQPRTDRDLMRLYELWQHTGSARAARLLRESGIVALPVANRRH
ncbi:MAG: hypothetical protein AB7Q97_17290 [Gammaproteobacteria bacterium]